MSTRTDDRSIRSLRIESFDGVPISYSISGSGEVALLLIHGGLADRSFWDGQHAAFSERYTVVTPDLAGHGESGVRMPWSILACAKDVIAVIEAESLQHVILAGNSLGGAVCMEAAALLGRRVAGVIGVDTFHDLSARMDETQANARAEAWRKDPEASLEQSVRALFHPDASPALIEDVKRRMSKMSVDAACAMFLSFGGYDVRPAARRLRVPVRCINGDLYPINWGGVRQTLEDFDAIVMPHIGHYPMLEAPEAFNQHLREIANSMTASH